MTGMRSSKLVASSIINTISLRNVDLRYYYYKIRFSKVTLPRTSNMASLSYSHHMHAPPYPHSTQDSFIKPHYYASNTPQRPGERSGNALIVTQDAILGVDEFTA
jgi:hypothetical protein